MSISSQALESGPPNQISDTVPAAGAFDLAMQIAWLLLSAGMSANDVALVTLRAARRDGPPTPSAFVHHAHPLTSRMALTTVVPQGLG
ncbi:MAG TPA: hypothetical protein VE462_12640 [Propionibacteriaceae bacterium]|nr:hypothetical protein [Propionibacteriaceae bacterium]